MTLTRSLATGHDELQELFDTLLYSVSHDLRSPLLTMSLSAELIADQATPTAGHAPSGVSVAMEALQHGAKDLERMLQAITALSRARRRALEDRGVRLQVLLGGQIVLSQEESLERRAVAVDPLVVREVIDALGGDAPLEVRASVESGFVVLRMPGTERTARVEGSPLRAVIGSLQTYAGTEVEALAASEIALSRQGASLATTEDAVVLVLPLLGTPG